MSLSKVRIPTILGLGLIAVSLFLGIAIFSYDQNLKNQQRTGFTPKDILVANITDSSASIIWQTDNPSTGAIAWGPTSYLGSLQKDGYTQPSEKPKTTHAVTLKNLQPETNYFFKIQSGGFFYPDNPQYFKTAKKVDPKSEQSSLNLRNKPVAGKILEATYEPTDEAVIDLSIPKAAPLGAVLSTNGNFLIPTANLYNDAFNNLFVLTDKTEARLTVKKGDIKSEVKFFVPLQEPLPPIILGQNLDLTKISAVSKTFSRLDLNTDGKINAIDLSLVIINIGKLKNPADVNRDGIVNENDLELMKKALQ